MIAGLSKAVTLYLATLLSMTFIFLSYFAYFAPVMLLADRVSLLSVDPSTVLQDNSASSDNVDGPTVHIGALGSCSRPKHDAPFNCTIATLSPEYDLSDLPPNVPGLLTSPPSSAPGFIAVSLGFSTIFVLLFTLISLRSKLGPKLGPALDKPFLNRAVAWLGLLGFMIGLTSFLVVRMWFEKAITDFNSGIQSLGKDGPAVIASAGNGFTMVWVAYAFLAVPLVCSLAKLHVTAGK